MIRRRRDLNKEEGKDVKEELKVVEEEEVKEKEKNISFL